MENQTELLDIYKINISKKISKKKILIILGFVVVGICLILTIRHCIKTINSYKVYKQYETQLQSILYQEEQKKIEIEAEKERKKQEKIPKLTQVRKG